MITKTPSTHLINERFEGVHQALDRVAVQANQHYAAMFKTDLKGVKKEENNYAVNR
ncbi:MAG: hypothetical protein L3J88_04805 [Gammaproteobacteria bacterium]|nr:hypothetical protein [Gammaproteobacteria bacterium]MCF6362660.1 hypothetical protein [Gammaproteobacteria bacterium]